MRKLTRRMPKEISRQAARALGQSKTLAVIETDLRGTITYCNAGVEAILGYSTQKLIGRSVESILPDELREDHRGRFHGYVEARRKSVARESGLVGTQRYFTPHESNDAASEYFVVAGDGTSIPISLTIHELHSLDGRLIGFVGCILDQRDQEALRNQIRERDEHDELTGLLCWRGICSRIRESLKRPNWSSTGIGVIYLDIDHFSVLSFRCKGSADRALVKTGRWLTNMVDRWVPENEAWVSRHFNASEFLVVVRSIATEELRTLADRLVSEFRGLNLGDFRAPYFGSVSAGVAQANTPQGFEFTVSAAARACFEARSLGHDRVFMLGSPSSDEYALSDQIRLSMELGAIDLMAQQIRAPDAENHESTGGLRFEILSRFRGPRGEQLPVERVFASAERLGMAYKLDLHILLATLGALSDSSLDLTRLDYCSINLSGSTISRVDACSLLENAIRSSGLNPARLCFEVTEGAEITDQCSAVRLMRHLRDLGCRVAIDDFGTGHSNFQSLVRAPVDCIKIDGSYTKRILEDPALRVDFLGMLASARVRGIEVIAEVVEDRNIARELTDLGVSWAQGYYLHRPEPLDNFLQSRLAG